MLPVEVRILPTYKVMVDLALIDTYTGLTVPLMASATATLLFRQFFLTIPSELVEAARVDGAGPFRFFEESCCRCRRPISRHSSSFSSSMAGRSICGRHRHQPQRHEHLVIALKKMIDFADANTQWHLVMVTCMLAILPPILVVVLMQRWFVKGLVETEK